MMSRAACVPAAGGEYDPRDRHGVLRVFGRDIPADGSPQRQQWLNRAFQYWRERGFPFAPLTSEMIDEEFRRLVATPPGSVLRGARLAPSTVGLRLANAFHPHIWRIKVNGASPVQRFKDDDVLRRILSRAPAFWPDRRCWNAQCIRSMMRINHRLANFRPAAAKAIIHQFSADGASVLDFSAGFGGRLLGALALKRRYVAVDPATRQVRGLTKMMRSLEGLALGTAEIHCACAEDLLPLMPSRSIDLVFSSPPYFNLERYSTEATQSYKRYSLYSEWRDRFLSVVIDQSHRILRRQGYLVINVANAGGLSIARDTLGFASRGFSLVRRLRLMMNAVPSARACGALYRYEPVYVLQKRCS